ncbi:acyltransferase family protein [Pedobacter arcticus]|uniref:acyltransferase family protein n=1 Tax=Pedobacter arcticus TaxID=752140 RepID=UPI0002EC5C8B
MLTKKLLNLDLLRALAILMVLAFHLTQMFFGHVIADGALFNLGKYGVNVFFVLSGYLVGSIYYKRDIVSNTTFWFRRFIRTYPPYLVMFFVSWLGVYLTRKEPFNINYIFMTQNFLEEIPFYLVSWSLCVEEHFYIIFTLGVFFIRNRQHQLKLWYLLAILPLLLRLFLSNPNSPTFGISTVASYLQFDSIIFGVIASYYVHKKGFRLIVRRYFVLIPMLTLLILGYVLVKFDGLLVFSFGMTILNANILLILLCLLFQESYTISNNSFIKLNSKISYSIYLVHPLSIHLTILLMSKLNSNNILLTLFLGLILVYVPAGILYFLVERPTQYIKEKYFKLA